MAGLMVEQLRQDREEVERRQNEEKEGAVLRKRNLLSIQEDLESCDMDDGSEDCGAKPEARVLKNIPKSLEENKKKVEVNSEIIEESKVKSKDSTDRIVERCETLAKDCDSLLSKLQSDRPTGSAKTKVKALGRFMRRMGRSKELLEEYQQLLGSGAGCETWLSQALVCLQAVQGQVAGTGWMEEVQSLVNTADPDTVQQLGRLMQQFKP